MKVVTFQCAEYKAQATSASGWVAIDKSVTIVKHKVAAIQSGGTLLTESDGGEMQWCTIILDGGMSCNVCCGLAKAEEMCGFED